MKVIRKRYIPIHERVVCKPDPKPKKMGSLHAVDLVDRPPTTGVVVSACAAAIAAGVIPGVRIMWSENAHTDLVEAGVKLEVVALRYPQETLIVIEEYEDDETPEEEKARVEAAAAEVAMKQSVVEHQAKIRREMGRCDAFLLRKERFCDLDLNHEEEHA